MDLSVNSLIFWPNVELLPDCVFLKKKKLLNVFLIFVFILKKKKLSLPFVIFVALTAILSWDKAPNMLVYLSKKH